MRCLALVLVFATTATAQPPDLLAPTDALSPADERKAFTVPPGFDVQLVASEPDIGKPMQMAFDAKGRLWVATSRLYPFPADDGKGTDKLYVLSDFGDDGKAKKITLFADNLNIPIGIMPLPSCDGCIVSNIAGTCEILKLTDTDGDSKADKSETLFSGFGTRDTHGMVNSFTLMPDGWVYACHGYLNASKVKGKDGHEIEVQSGNVLRFRLDGSRIEVFTRGQVNPFGLAVDPWFNLYTADCHSRPMTALIPGAVYESFGKPHDGLGYGPNMIGYEPGGTGMCGLAWYDAAHFPKEHLGMMYLGNVITNRVNVAKIEWTGATPKAVQQQDLIASSDRWFRPVDIKLGPDGAIYVSDFYNKVIGHYEMPLTHPGRDKDRGRIWRVVYKGTDGKAPPPKMPRDWTKATTDELVSDAKSNPNLTVRMLALNQYIHKVKVPEKAAPNAAINSYLDLANVVVGAESGIPDVNLDVRRTLLRVKVMASTPNWTPEEYELARKGIADPNAGVNTSRAWVEALGTHLHPDNVKPLVELIRKTPPSDTHLRHAARIALRNTLWSYEQLVIESALWPGKDAEADDIVADVLLGIPTRPAALYHVAHLERRERPAAVTAAFVEHAARHGARTELVKLQGMIQDLLRGHTAEEFARGAALQRDMFRGMQAGGKKFGRSDMASFQLRDKLIPLMAKDATSAKVFVESLGVLPSVCDDTAREACGEVVATSLQSLATTPAIAEEVRVAALLGLGRAPSPRAMQHLLDVLNDPAASAAFREAAIVSLAQVQDRRARGEVNVALKGVPYRVALAAAMNMASTPAGGGELLAGVKAGFVPARVLQDKVVLERLKASKVADWEKRVGDLTRGLPAADVKVAELIKQRGATFAAAKGDKEQGAKLFTKHCAACHAIAGAGGKIAPQLDGVGIRGLERILEDVLDPNRNVDVAFRARVLNLFDGTTKTGLMIKVDGEVLVMADGEGKEFRVPLKDIEKNRETALSPMPANVADIMTEAEFAHLIAYLLDQKAKDAPAVTPKTFRPLFNGTDLAGWHGWKVHDKAASPLDLDKLDADERAKKRAEWTADAVKHWRVENGELVNDGKGAALATGNDYADFELIAECKHGELLLRSATQIKGGDEWSTYRAVVIGERASLWLDGSPVFKHERIGTTSDHSAAPKRATPIVLVSRAGGSRWRNVRVREIGSEEANEILRSHNTAGFESVFNGKDFTGWAGPTENYEVIDGAIVCKPKKGGNIYTTGQYADFVARLEYKLPPGGNNGLAIRYPGGGKHAATEGMCEVQILDDTATKYAKLDPRQFNGSAYGMAAAHRGYLRPLGEWNVMEVTARGPLLQVELNGTRILDTDMSKLTEFKDKQAHPGKDRPSGHFGFCGHNDPVAFRNLQIRTIK